MDQFISVNEPLLGGNEKKYLNECLDAGWISSEGPFVKKFEEEFAKKVGRKYAIAVSNGTTALEAAVVALNIGENDEVIMPTFTIISCAAAIIRAKATPVLVDSCPETWNMDISQLEAKITKKTKAIMIVHIYGLPVDMNPILEIAKKHQLKVIEDAAQMIGQQYHGSPCGSFGDLSCFSFYPNKHITTGEGGMIVTDDENTAERCRSLRNLCFDPQNRFVHHEMGWNFRMTNMQAAIGLAQLEALDKHILLKRQIGNLYNERLSNLEMIQTPLAKTDYAENIYWVYGIMLDKNLGMNAKDVMKKLAAKNIGTRPFFYPMHQQPIFNKMGLFLGEKHPVSENMYEMGFYIPSGLSITPDQIEIVSNELKKILL